MTYFILIGIVSLLASLLTFFSGFGLGTLLLPVFALFFKLPIAVGLTAIVHFLNNIFKFLLIKKNINKSILFKFASPAIPAAFLGSALLMYIGNKEPLYIYFIGDKECKIEIIKLTFSLLMIIFSLFEILPQLKKWSVDKKYLSVGGFLSGFFGGLSGHQGALRSAFLIKSGLSKEEFVATGIATACLVDITRLGIYGFSSLHTDTFANLSIRTVASLCAFVGAYLGSKLLTKVTLGVVQNIVSILMFFTAILIGMGII